VSPFVSLELSAGPGVLGPENISMMYSRVAESHSDTGVSVADAA
jgi:hypothetical protein